MEFLIKEATLKQHESSSGRNNPCGACANMMLPWVNRGLLLKCGEMLWPKAEATSSEFAKKAWDSVT